MAGLQPLMSSGRSWLVRSTLAACSLVAIYSLPAMAQPQRTALLGVHIHNDNEGFQPTSADEIARANAVAQSFMDQLTASGKYQFVAVPQSEQRIIDAGQALGTCGGCEFEYGKKLNAELIAWIHVQKISNLVLNMNVYMGDVSQGKITFIKSVDLRNNTDESWARGINYLVQNYLLPQSQG